MTGTLLAVSRHQGQQVSGSQLLTRVQCIFDMSDRAELLNEVIEISRQTWSLLRLVRRRRDCSSLGRPLYHALYNIEFDNFYNWHSTLSYVVMDFRGDTFLTHKMGGQEGLMLDPVFTAESNVMLMVAVSRRLIKWLQTVKPQLLRPERVHHAVRRVALVEKRALALLSTADN